MTQKEFDAIMVTINEGQQKAVKPYIDVINKCMLKRKEILIKIQQLKLELDQIGMEQKQADIERARIATLYHNKKSLLCELNPKDSIEEPKGETQAEVMQKVAEWMQATYKDGEYRVENNKLIPKDEYTPF